MITRNVKNKTLVNTETSKKFKIDMIKEWLYQKKTALLRHYHGGTNGHDWAAKSVQRTLWDDLGGFKSIYCVFKNWATLDITCAPNLKWPWNDLYAQKVVCELKSGCCGGLQYPLAISHCSCWKGVCKVVNWIKSGHYNFRTE